MFKIGETVRHNSGGPLMTIDSLNDDGTVTCCWFDKNNSKCQDNFKIDAISFDDGMPPTPIINE